MSTTPSSEILRRTGAFFRERRPEAVISAYVFGSHAAGTAHDESDLDVGVVFDLDDMPDRGARSRCEVDLSAALVGSVHLDDVQVVSLLDVSPELAAIAVREGRRVYCADADGDRAVTRQILLRAADLAPFLRRTRERKVDVLKR